MNSTAAIVIDPRVLEPALHKSLNALRVHNKPLEQGLVLTVQDVYRNKAAHETNWRQGVLYHALMIDAAERLPPVNRIPS